MKYYKGQKVQDKRDNIRGRVVDYFEQDDTRYWIETQSGKNYCFPESKLEPVFEARLLAFILRTWRFIKSDWIVSAIIFALGFIGGLLL